MRGAFYRDDAEDGRKDYALHFAAASNHVDCVSDCLRRGENVNQVSKFAQRTSLMVAARSGYLDVIRCLLSHGADVNMKDNRHNNAVWYAASEGHVGCLGVLLDAGGSYDVISKFSKQKPLSAAALNGHFACVQKLLDHGDTFGLYDDEHSRWFSFDNACGISPISILSADTAKTLVNLMIREEGSLAFDILIVVIKMNDPEFLCDIFDRKVTITDAKRNATGVNYNIALHSAVKSGNDRTIDVLLERKDSLGIHVNGSFGMDPRTALQKACDKQESNVVDVLLKHGADPEKVGSLIDDGNRPPVFITLRTLAYMDTGLNVLASLLKLVLRLCSRAELQLDVSTPGHNSCCFQLIPHFETVDAVQCPPDATMEGVDPLFDCTCCPACEQ